jgi:hypothetical protein
MDERAAEALSWPPFLPGGKICRLEPLQMQARLIASREYGLY